MKLDTKQKVLIAIYTEYQKDIPDMRDAITYSKLGIDSQRFVVALEKLENEELIRGIDIARSRGRAIDVFTDNIMMTSIGIEYVENKLGIEKTLSGLEKIKYMYGKYANWGWEQGKEIISSTLAKIIQDQTGA
ncbi:Uncharacterised protein [uncultured Clostridium sp.]|nr:Uncharacterised protein [uncultured Clostridium sp.]